MQHHVQAHGWWRDYYETYPRKGINGSDAWGTGKSQKYKMDDLDIDNTTEQILGFKY